VAVKEVARLDEEAEDDYSDYNEDDQDQKGDTTENYSEDNHSKSEVSKPEDMVQVTAKAINMLPSDKDSDEGEE